MKIEIEVCVREMDFWICHTGKRMPKYHAQIKNDPGYWSCGISMDDAIGNLIRTHPERFNIEVTRLGKLPR